MNKLKGYFERKEGEVIGIASTPDADRDGEMIMQDGWDLNNFRMNPVIMASHNYHEFPIGKATDIKIEDGKLVFKMIFSKATEKAKEAYELVKEGIMNTFSVGFIPREFDEEDQNKITKAELLEISLVSVPANPNAVVVAKGMKENDLAKSLIKQWLTDEDMKKKVKKIEEKQLNQDTEAEVRGILEGKANRVNVMMDLIGSEDFNEDTEAELVGLLRSDIEATNTVMSLLGIEKSVNKVSKKDKDSSSESLEKKAQSIGEKGAEGRSEDFADLSEMAIKKAISVLQSIREQQKKGGVKK